MGNIYVVDTVALINYFNNIFIEENKISFQARKLIDEGFSEYSNIKLVIPSVVFLEIHAKFLSSREKLREFKFEVFNRIKESPDIEVKPIEKNVLEIFSKMDDSKIKLEHNDKIIVSSAIDIQVPLITIDSEIIDYLEKYKNVVVIK